VAKDNRLHWGLSTAIAGKFQLFPGNGTKYDPFGHWGLCITNVVDGKDENSLSFTHRTGFYRDNIAYVPVNGLRFTIENINFIVNPEILFPTKYPFLHVTAGFGLDWISVANISMETTDINSLGSGFEAAADSAIASQKKLVPFANIGLRWHIKRKAYIHCYLRQNMLNSMEGDPVLQLGTAARPLPVRLFHKPTYVGIAFSWYLN
jgi:hypothetical protein